ncbi:MAG: hypothetical protein IJV93_08945, partial [Lentisphaeria bacterium]|nr:hypothetical protein [Lentisphaeria bacterium]
MFNWKEFIKQKVRTVIGFNETIKKIDECKDEINACKNGIENVQAEMSVCKDEINACKNGIENVQ